MISVSQESTRTRRAVFWRYTAALKVGQREDREADEGGISHGETPSAMDAG